MTRIESIRERLNAEDIDAVALVPGPTLQWVTGEEFVSSERLTLLLVPANGVPSVVLPNFEKANWRGGVSFEAEVFLWDDSVGPEDALKEAVASIGTVRTVAMEPLSMRVMEYERLRRFMPEADLVAAGAITDSLRLLKDASEIASMRRAIAVSEAALESVLQTVKPGSTEIEIATRLSAALLEGGGQGISFGPIVLSGPQSALPHGVPSERALGKGELLLIDFGTNVDGYHSDITRTFVIGAEPDALTRRVYKTVLAGNAAGCAACRPGAEAHEIHRAAQAGFDAPEFAGYMTHRTGHGLGLDIHEPPSIMNGNHEPVRPGMVFTVEPGLYKEGWGGVRIEDDVVITDSGVDILTSFSKELRVVG